MLRKIIIIILLSSGLAVLLYLKPWKEEIIKPPRIEDRLPTADFLGVMNPLEFVKEMSVLINFNKVKYRQLLTYDFLLSQSRSLGINLQNPVFLFGFENGNWGCVIELNDDSKIEKGLEQLSSIFKLEKKKKDGLDYIYVKSGKIFIFHEKDYLLVYKGDDFSDVLSRIHNSSYGDVKSEWINFLKEKTFKSESFIIYSNWNKLADYGIEKGMFAIDNDSVNIKLKTYLKKVSPFYISQKSGPSITNSTKANKNKAEIHLDIQEFKKHPEDPLYKAANKISKRYGFPFADFINAWDGDMSFREEGTTTATEVFLETELDEEFNPVLIEKNRQLIVPAYSCHLTFNSKFDKFYKKLVTKGLVTEENDKLRFLISPELMKKRTRNSLSLYSSVLPSIENSKENRVQWTFDGTTYIFTIDTISGNELYGTIGFSSRRILKNQKIIVR